MPEKQIDVTGQIHKIGETISEYKDKLVATFKDMDVGSQRLEFRRWKSRKGIYR